MQVRRNERESEKEKKVTIIKSCLGEKKMNAGPNDQTGGKERWWGWEENGVGGGGQRVFEKWSS